VRGRQQRKIWEEDVRGNCARNVSDDEITKHNRGRRERKLKDEGDGEGSKLKRKV
jgi:hypothetical protein